MFVFRELVGAEAGTTYGYSVYRGSHRLAVLDSCPGVSSREGGIVATALHSAVARAIAIELGFGEGAIDFNGDFAVVR